MDQMMTTRNGLALGELVMDVQDLLEKPVDIVTERNYSPPSRRPDGTPTLVGRYGIAHRGIPLSGSA